MTRLILLSFLVLGFHLHADPFVMPETVELSSKKLVLNGMGVREYSILMFNLDVYFAGLYLEKKTTSENAILRSGELKQVRMVFLRDVEAPDMRDTWRKYLEQNYEGDWNKISHSVDRYLLLWPDVKKDEVVINDFYPSKVVMTINNRKAGEINDINFPSALLATWIGKKPSTQSLKNALLGKATP